MKSKNHHRIFSGAAAAFSLTILSSAAAIIEKADNANGLDLSESWLGGVGPGSWRGALWDGTGTSGNTACPGDKASCGGIRITGPGGAVTVSGALGLTLGADGIGMSVATQNLTPGKTITTGVCLLHRCLSSRDGTNNAANTAIAVQYGSTLTGWATAVAGPDIIFTPTENCCSVSPGVDKIEVKIKRNLAVGSKLFARLNVVQAP